MSLSAPPSKRLSPPSLLERFRAVRAQTRALAAPLSPEDQTIQAMPDASPTKWHLAHTTWFFEEFVLKPHVPSYTVFHPKYAFIFNSYYYTVGDMFTRAHRGLLSRPTVETILAYRDAVNDAVESFLTRASSLPDELARTIEIGLHHEQQHQELILTDILYTLSINPLHPAYIPLQPSPAQTTHDAPPLRWVSFEGGTHTIGHDATRDAFAFDNESPQHTTLLRPFSIASRPITNGDVLEFIQDGGYRDHRLWLSDGWAAVLSQTWSAPLYWKNLDGAWHTFTLRGLLPLDLNAPASHLSLYEVDAFARWAKRRLPTEAEWEIATRTQPTQGNFVEQQHFRPMPHSGDTNQPIQHAFGDVWEWTASPYTPYPGYAPLSGALGEYNGKFMCSQIVLRGGSCATPHNHIRPTYRNFFPPNARWQFAGARLASDS